MMAMMHFATLVIATLLATGAAVLVDGLLLRAMFRLMAPAGRLPLRVSSHQSELVRGTAKLIRAYGA